MQNNLADQAPVFIASVALPLNLSTCYSYYSYERLFVGDIVEVNFSGKKYAALVLEVEQYEQLPDMLYKIKAIERSYNLRLSNELVEFAKFFANYTLTPIGLVATLLLRNFTDPELLNQAAKKTKKNKDIATQCHELSGQQLEAANRIKQLQDEKNFATILLQGVTGSGKTEVYFDALRRVIESGGQAVILLPEIALTGQIIARFEKSFGFSPEVWHSTVSGKKKRQTWYDVQQQKSKIVIGARSALFLPFSNLQLIIVDEEHDSSFKQEENIFYNARDMAVARGQFARAVVILASATPTVETMVNALHGKYHHINLKSRHGKSTLPQIKIIDMNQQNLVKGKYFAPALLEAMEQNLKKGEQTILFLPRRGYAPLTLCRHCGYRIRCPNCSSYVTLHQSKSVFLCHYCGYTERITDKCAGCGEESALLNIGCGIERLGEEVQAIFPQARLMLLSTDFAGNLSLLRKQLKLIEHGEVDIVIGTQLISKGHNFSKVSLVGVIDSEADLHNSEFRATERTFQTLMQVTGRAGRAGQQSFAYLQSYNAEHSVIKALVHNDIDEFYQNEIRLRQKLKMPPFARLASIIISSKDALDAKNLAHQLRREMPNVPGLDIWGPSVAYMAMIRNLYRYRIILRANKNFNMQKYLAAISARYRANRKATIQIDIDPYSLA